MAVYVCEAESQPSCALETEMKKKKNVKWDVDGRGRADEME